MNIVKDRLYKLPHWVFYLLHHNKFTLYLVGSAANYILGEEIIPNDYDLIGPQRDWQKVYNHLQDLNNRDDIDIELNKMLGFRFQDGEVDIDIWCHDIDKYLSELPKNSPKYAINLKEGLIISRENFN